MILQDFNTTDTILDWSVGSPIAALVIVGSALIINWLEGHSEKDSLTWMEHCEGDNNTKDQSVC